MFIRVYMNASTELEATTHLQKLLNLGEKIQLPLKREKMAPYLDFQDSYEIELESHQASDKQLLELLEGIATRWNELPSSMVAIKQDNCLLMEQVEMIEVFPEN
ncbi:hypothetical protein [Kurthia sibirica]|uniref:Uncharacterized protein n=1 Tax=Kurthia sibirica TaxID=202750 RepID=A0A2U3ALC1_9BACL|nr:hypothetical protein [Kurthia sibirica]PWI25335.1 hypothetical protein DEX24_08315 [Kurthia sibirica]GEK34419.1 hypothetical protein KSI01_19520 [Kurthia sibirica]